MRKAAGRGLTYGACHRLEVEIAELVHAGFSGMEPVLTSLSRSLFVPVQPGRHELALQIAAADGAPWAGTAQAWLVGSERVAPVEVRLAARRPLLARRPLPPSALGPSELPISVRLGETALPPR